MEPSGTSHVWLGFNFFCAILFAASAVLWLPLLLSVLRAGSGWARGELAGCDQHGTAQLTLPSPCTTEAPGQGSVATGDSAVTGHSWAMPDLGWQHSRELCWRTSPLRPEKSRASPGVRVTKAPAWAGRGLRTQAAPGCSALLLQELSKLPGSEAVCLQLDRLPRLSTPLPHSRCWVEQEQSGASSGSG